MGGVECRLADGVLKQARRVFWVPALPAFGLALDPIELADDLASGLAGDVV